MKKLTFPTTAVVLMLAITSCIRDNGAVEPVSGKPIDFTSGIAGATRAFNQTWESDDEIGVFMFLSEETLADSGDANKRYVNTTGEAAEVVFEAVDANNTLYYPTSGDAVDFIAYYPYLETLADRIYPVNIAVQGDQSAIDVMYADNVTNKTSGNPALIFSHKLSKLVFNVTDADGADLAGMVSTIEGLATTADFDLATGALDDESLAASTPFTAYLSSTEDEDEDSEQTEEVAVIEAVVIPTESSFSLTMTLASGEQAVFTVEDYTYEPGKRYIYEITLNSPDRIGFGDGVSVDGELSSISPWDDVPVDGNEIPKTGDDEGGDDGEEWSEILKDGFDGVTGGSIGYQNTDSPWYSGTDNFTTFANMFPAGEGVLRFSANGSAGSITSRPLDLSSPFRVTVTMSGYDETQRTLKVIVGGQTQNVTCGADEIGGVWGTHSVEFEAATSSSYIQIKAPDSTARAFIDEVVVEVKD